MGGVVAGVIGVIIGLLTIRLGNLYIALVTLTFALLMERLVFTLDTFAQNGIGRVIVRPEFVSTDRGFLYLTLGVFAFFSVLIVNLRRSTTGLALNAVRWSETASRTMGLSVLQMKLLVSGLAAFVAGVGGGLYATQQKAAVPATYATLLGLAWLAVLVTFGVRSNIAALARRHRLHDHAGPAPQLHDSHVGATAGAAVRRRRDHARQEPGGHRPHAGDAVPTRAAKTRWRARAVPAATAFAGRNDHAGAC